MDEDTKLMIAAQKGCLSQITKLLDAGADVNEQNAHRGTALGYAIAGGKLPVIKLLLSRGADLTTVNENGITLLMLAAYAGEEKVIQYLLDLGVEVDAVCVHGSTALQYAAKEKHTNAIKVFLDNGADVDHIDNDGDTALSVCKYGRCAEARSLLISHSTQKNKLQLNKEQTKPWLFTNLMEAFFERDMDLMKKIIAHSNNINKTYTIQEPTKWYEISVLSMAIMRNEREYFDFLLEQGADVNCEVSSKNHSTPLFIAVEFGRLDMIKILLKKGALYQTINGNSKSAFLQAIKYKQVEIVKYFLDNGSDANEEEQAREWIFIKRKDTALIIAAGNNDTETSQLLLERGALVNFKTEHEQTALNKAVQRRAVDVVKILVENGAKIPVNGLATMGFGEYIETSLLSVAACTGNIEMLEYLLSLGVDLQMRDKEGYTPLARAIKSYEPEAAAYLVERGANLETITHDGKSILDLMLDSKLKNITEDDVINKYNNYKVKCKRTLK